MKNVVLIGLSGSGKTTLGQKLAARLGRRFVDLDALVCEKTGLSIPKLFAGYGEPFFRDLESAAVAEAAAGQNLVIATGGGAVLRKENAEKLRQNGFVVFLDRPVDAIVSDVSCGERPLLQQGAEALYKLSESRRDTYLACAHLVLDNSAGQDEALEKLVAASLPLEADGYAVIGEPIGHTKSPAIHKAAFAFLGKQAEYRALRVPRGTLAEFVAGVRASGMGGFNITIPHKADILPLLDEVDKEAALCGAVNTVVHKNGKLIGYNTDMGGLSLALQRAEHGYANRRVLLLGAGGAARAVALKAVLEKAAALCILARRPEAAQALADHVRTAAAVPVTWGEMNPEGLSEAAAGCDLLVNATPLGMQGMAQDFEDLAFLQHLPPGAFVCDIVYAPPKTRLLSEAERLGHPILNGLDMLIFQAVLAQERFWNKTLDRDGLYTAIQKQLHSE